MSAQGRIIQKRPVVVNDQFVIHPMRVTASTFDVFPTIEMVHNPRVDLHALSLKFQACFVNVFFLDFESRNSKIIMSHCNESLLNGLNGSLIMSHY